MKKKIKTRRRGGRKEAKQDGSIYSLSFYPPVRKKRNPKRRRTPR